MGRLDTQPPEREARRLATLCSYDVLDTAPEARFDEVTSLVAEICEVPMAFISLVDDRRQWFKSRIALGVSETGREIAFCAHTIEQTDLFIVEDAWEDPRFTDNPLVRGDLSFASTPARRSSPPTATPSARWASPIGSRAS